MGLLTPEMKALAASREGDINYPTSWTTLGEYMTMLQRRGIAPNVASFVGAGTVRTNLLAEADVQPTFEQLKAMQLLAKQAMEEARWGAATGRFVRGRRWTEARRGECRASATDWHWTAD